ncbi:MAG: hypothetical protein JST01_12700 [Cyanobacteria bacterium SZAS TMP-1]|nr:hypothetical protein [Cyanobacteria bacterium SZAS TMP-1]
MAGTIDSTTVTDSSKKPQTDSVTPVLRDDIKPQDHREAVGTPRAASADALAKREQSVLSGPSIDFAAQGDIYSCRAEVKPPNVRASDEQVLGPDRFAAVGKRVLEKLADGHPGGVSRELLAANLQNPAFKGEESQAIAAMYKNYGQLLNLSHTLRRGQKHNLSEADLTQFQTMAQERLTTQAETLTMKDWARTDLKKFAHDGGEYLSKSDVNRALSNPATSERDRAVLGLVQKHFSEMDSMFNFSGLTAKDFEALDQKVFAEGNGKIVMDVFGACYGVASEGQKAGVCYDLYKDPDPLRSIAPDSVKQGSIGDCYYEAVVASLAKTNPELIRDSIKDNGNGCYTVTFAGAKNEPITVKAPTEAELGLYNHAGQNGVWASVMEKAYGQYRHNHAGRRGDVPQEGADGGGRPEPVIKLLTGSDASWMPTARTSQAELVKSLESAFSARPSKVVVTGTDADNSWHGYFFTPTDKTADNFYRQHEYSITGFTPDGKGGGKVIVRNPWGGADNTPNGTIEVPIEKFMTNFGDVSIQK